MARKRSDMSLPIAISTMGGLLSTLAVLFAGTVQGMRAWILLIRSAMAFMLVSGVLKLLTAGVLQAIRWKATRTDARHSRADREEIEQVSETITASADNLESVEKGTS
jgi:hypothetical protein